MRKQVDFDIRVFDIVAGSNTGEGGMTHEQVREFVKTNYLDNGWEVIHSEVAQISANHVFFAVSLAKYDEVGSVVVPQQLAGEKRGPGRPAKVATENVS